MAERDVTREVEQSIARKQREADAAAKALEQEIAAALLEVVTTPGLRRDEPVADTDTEASYAKKLESALRAEFLKHAGGR